MVTPLVIQAVDDAKLPPLPYLLAVAMGSNVGSVATFTGNPQNMLIGQLSGISYAEFAALMTPIAAVTSVACALLLVLLFRKQLPRGGFELQSKPPPVDRPLMRKSLVAFGLVVAAFFAGLPTAWSALTIAALLIAVGGRAPRRIFERVDFVLLVFFVGLFVVVHGVDATGWTSKMLESVKPWMGGSTEAQVTVFSTVSVIGSNIFSNVPFVMLVGKWVPALSNPKLMWLALALTSTLAGNLTLIGSMANLIVAESAHERHPIGFLEYLVAGVPVTILTTGLGVAMLLAMHAAGAV
jgi:Na+/H+ antiporter NhaD/arsenite permease-like protein